MSPGDIIPLSMILNSTYICSHDAILTISLIPKIQDQNNHILMDIGEALSSTKNIYFPAPRGYMKKEDREEKRGPFCNRRNSPGLML